MATQRETSELQIDQLVGRTLLAGLLLSVAVMVLGLVLLGVSGVSPTAVLPLGEIVPALLDGNAEAVLDLGILLLFATPLVGVVVALAGFVLSRDVPFTVVSLVLVLVIAAGFVVALR